MLSNYLKISYRSTLRNKLHSFINIFGLTIGLVSFIIIFIWIRDELKFDRFYSNVDHLYQLTITHQGGVYTNQDNVLDPNVPYALAPLISDNVPGINLYSRFYRLSNLTTCAFKHQEEERVVTFYEENVCLVDTGFLKMFSFPFLSGNPDNALNNPNNIVINKTIAEKYFGKSDPIGKTLNLNNTSDHIVSGVIDIPENTHFKINFLLPLDKDLKEDWNWRDPSYVLLHEKTDRDSFRSGIEKILHEFTPYPSEHLKVDILPIAKSHLSFGRMKYIYIFSVVAIFILVIAGINYINITMANAMVRYKEIGIRRIHGAIKPQLIKQILLEAFFLSIISLFISLIIIEILLPVLNTMLNKDLKAGYFDNPLILVYFLLLVLIYGFFAGIFPALFFSSAQTLSSIRSGNTSTFKKSRFKTISVLIQVMISILLISSTLIIFRQLKFIQNAPLGFSTDRVISLTMNRQIGMRLREYLSELKQYSSVQQVTAGQAHPYNEDYKTSGIEWSGKDPDFTPNVRYSVTLNGYIEAFDMEIVEGKSFSENFIFDMSNYVINESAVKYMSLEDPIGQKINFWGIEGNVIGVVKDFHHVPLNKEIMPHIFSIHPNHLGALKHIFIKIDNHNVQRTLSYIENTTKKFAPDFPVDIRFLDEGKQKLYASEKSMGQVITLFAFIAIFISCLGIFGLAKFNVEQRTKEIGIRKVNGATVREIVYLLNWDVSKIVILAMVIVTPVAYFIIRLWLQNFAYKIPIGIWTFVLTGMIVFVSALLSIINVTLKASLKNPVDSLKYE